MQRAFWGCHFGTERSLHGWPGGDRLEGSQYTLAYVFSATSLCAARPQFRRCDGFCSMDAPPAATFPTDWSFPLCAVMECVQ
jgi:hypothetical protein